MECKFEVGERGGGVIIKNKQKSMRDG